MDSIKLASHKRPPIYKPSTKRVSYKLFDVDNFVDCLHEQDNLLLKQCAFFAGSQELNKPSTVDLDEEIERATQRDPWNLFSNNGQSTQASWHSKIEVGEGTGRATREIEVEASSHGKLEIRFFCKKLPL